MIKIAAFQSVRASRARSRVVCRIRAWMSSSSSRASRHLALASSCSTALGPRETIEHRHLLLKLLGSAEAETDDHDELFQIRDLRARCEEDVALVHLQHARTAASIGGRDVAPRAFGGNERSFVVDQGLLSSGEALAYAEPHPLLNLASPLLVRTSGNAATPALRPSGVSVGTQTTATAGERGVHNRSGNSLLVVGGDGDGDGGKRLYDGGNPSKRSWGRSSSGSSSSSSPSMSVSASSSPLKRSRVDDGDGGRRFGSRASGGRRGRGRLSGRNYGLRRSGGDDDDDEGGSPAARGGSSFITGTDKLILDEELKQSGPGSSNRPRLGISRRNSNSSRSKFVAPFKRDGDEDEESAPRVRNGISRTNAPGFVKKAFEKPKEDAEEVPEQLKNCDPELVETISNEILERRPAVKWSDIAGLEFAKQCVMEIVVWPLKRPDFFTGLRAPPKGILLFGPPGTGKTMIGRAIASEAGATFFSISAASLGSKWHGEGEKLVRTLFAVASVHQPSIIFIDEIDSLLCQRSDSDHEGSRRMKNEFLIRLEGASTPENERVLVVGATNRPQELDEAARRRLVKRLYIPLPDAAARGVLIRHLLSSEHHDLSEDQINRIVAQTDGYSGSDLRAMCTEAAFGPIRSMGDISSAGPSAANMRPINYADFEAASKQVRASVSPDDLQQYVDWNSKYGSFPMDEHTLAAVAGSPPVVE